MAAFTCAPGINRGANASFAQPFHPNRQPSIRDRRVPRHARVTRRTCAPLMAFKDNLSQLPHRQGQVIDLYAFCSKGIRQSKMDKQIANQKGSSASFQIYANVLHDHRGVLDITAAQEALHIYAEIVDEAASHRGSHPNVDTLLEIVNDPDGGISYVGAIDGDYLA